jgi:hypothetical protein
VNHPFFRRLGAFRRKDLLQHFTELNNVQFEWRQSQIQQEAQAEDRPSSTTAGNVRVFVKTGRSSGSRLSSKVKRKIGLSLLLVSLA